MSQPPATTALLAYDGSAPAKGAVECAGRLWPGSAVRVATCWRSARQAAEGARLALPDGVIEGGCATLDEAAAAEALKVAGEGAELARDMGLDATPMAVEVGSTVAAAILAFAEVEHAGVLVLGTRGRSGVKAALLGSVSHAVLHHATRPVMVVPAEAAAGAEGPVAVGFDGSADAARALRATTSLFPRGSVLVIYAWEPFSQVLLTGASLDPYAMPDAGELSRNIDRAREADAEEVAESGVAIAREAGMDATACVVRADSGVWQAVVGEAERRGAAVMAVGARGRGRAASALLGSVSRGVVHHAGVPVLVVPPGD